MRPGIDLYWLPLGAGGHSVRLNGRVFEAVAVRLARRTLRALLEGAVGIRSAERFRIFRYADATVIRALLVPSIMRLMGR